jgi:polysaccharide pyruvyl transferase CsaB
MLGRAPAGSANRAPVISTSATASGATSRVLILCGDAEHNLGDRAILQAMCQELRAARPDIKLTVLSRNARRAAQDFGADVLPPGWRGLARVCRAAAASDLVLCGGGGLFQDDDSLIKMPYWGLRVAFARLLSPRVVGYALGVGPLRAASSRLFARLAFACMEQVSVRDHRARAVAQALTGKPVIVLPDPALLLRAAEPETTRAWLAAKGVPLDGRPLVGVAARRWFPPRRRIIPHQIAVRLGLPDEQRSAAGNRLLDLIAEVLNRMVRRHDAYVLFLPTYCVPHEGDDRVCEQILRRMRKPAGRVLRIEGASLYKAVAGQLDVMLGGRMHPTIFAAAAGTPVVGLAYNQKFRGFFDLLGCPERVLDLQSFVRCGRVDELEAMLNAVLGAGRLDLARIEALGRGLRNFNHRLLRDAA